MKEGLVIPKLTSCKATCLPILLFLALLQPANAGSGIQLPTGQPVCLEKAPGESGLVGAWHERLDLYFSPLTSKRSPTLYAVHGLLSGTQVTAPPFPVHTHPVSGSAVLAPANDRLGDAIQWHISLTGAASASDVNGSADRAGIVIETFALQLDPKTLAGMMTGRKVFSPISQNGQPFSPAMDIAIKMPLVSVKCER